MYMYMLLFVNACHINNDVMMMSYLPEHVHVHAHVHVYALVCKCMFANACHIINDVMMMSYLPEHVHCMYSCLYTACLSYYQ